MSGTLLQIIIAALLPQASFPLHSIFPEGVLWGIEEPRTSGG